MLSVPERAAQDVLLRAGMQKSGLGWCVCVTDLPKGNSESSFLVKQFFNVTMVPHSPFKGFVGRVIKILDTLSVFI